MLLLHDDIIKADTAPNVALMKMRLYLDTNEPKLVKFLQSFWDKQQRVITYKEIREAILAGFLTQEMMDSWQQDYSKFVVDYVAPLWIDAMEAANKPIYRNGLVWKFRADQDGIKKWTDTQAARFVTNCTQEQILAMRHVIQQATQLHNMNVDTLSHVIRPMIGLDYRQAAANMNYFNNMIESGLSEKKAIDRCVRYSARQNRYRAYRISRTELSFAYNQGSYYGTQQAQQAGFLGHTVKQWCTADDERVCDICGPMDGKEIEMDDDFTYEKKDKAGNTQTVRINPRLKSKVIGKVPPAHPHCRCTVLYIEKDPIILEPENE